MSEEEPFVVALDIDGVFADLVGGLKQFLVDGDYVHHWHDLPEPVDFHFSNWPEEARHRTLTLVDDSEFYSEYVSYIPGYSELLDWLDKSSIEYYFLTSRSDSLDGVTRDFLTSIVCEGKGFSLSHASSAIDKLGHEFDLLIDDHPCLVGEDRVLTFSQSWNEQSVEEARSVGISVPVVETYTEAVEYIDALLETHRVERPAVGAGETPRSSSSRAKPSPIDVLGRWPRAILSISALTLLGDEKYGVESRDRGKPIDMEKYNEAYSREKMMRHEAMDAAGIELDRETGVPHIVAVAWHALNRIEARLDALGYSAEDVIEGNTLSSVESDKPEGDDFYSVDAVISRWNAYLKSDGRIKLEDIDFNQG